LLNNKRNHYIKPEPTLDLVVERAIMGGVPSFDKLRMTVNWLRMI